MKEEISGFRKYYSFRLDDFIILELKNTDSLYLAKRRAKEKLRMYANLFNRDMRRILLTKESRCSYCNSCDDLQIDHIKPICFGGLNEINNIQVLCRKCNRKKSNYEN